LGLDNVTIYNPIGYYNAETVSIKYKLIVTEPGWLSDSAFVKVKVFKTNPSIFVPTALLHGDGKNDVSGNCRRHSKDQFFQHLQQGGTIVIYNHSKRSRWDGKNTGVPQGTTLLYGWSALSIIWQAYFPEGTTTLIR